MLSVYYKLVGPYQNLILINALSSVGMQALSNQEEKLAAFQINGLTRTSWSSKTGGRSHLKDNKLVPQLSVRSWMTGKEVCRKRGETGHKGEAQEIPGGTLSNCEGCASPERPRNLSPCRYSTLPKGLASQARPTLIGRLDQTLSGAFHHKTNIGNMQCALFTHSHPLHLLNSLKIKSKVQSTSALTDQTYEGKACTATEDKYRLTLLCTALKHTVQW